MAIITIAAPLSGIRGTVGGVVYSANGSGPYCKAWTMPSRQLTTFQSIVRSHIPTYKPLWDSMSSAQRTAWNNFAASPNELDYNSLGVQYYLSGYNWFVRANFRRAVVGLAWTATPPPGGTATTPTGISIVPDFQTSGTCIIDWTDGFFGATDSCIVHIAIAPSPYQAYPPPNWRSCFAVYNPGNGGDDIASAVELYFGTPAQGWTVFARFWNQPAGGNRSVYAATSAQVT